MWLGRMTACVTVPTKKEIVLRHLYSVVNLSGAIMRVAKFLTPSLAHETRYSPPHNFQPFQMDRPAKSVRRALFGHKTIRLTTFQSMNTVKTSSCLDRSCQFQLMYLRCKYTYDVMVGEVGR